MGDEIEKVIRLFPCDQHPHPAPRLQRTKYPPHPPPRQQEEDKPTAAFPSEPEALDAAAALAPAVEDFGAVAPAGVGAAFGEPVAAAQWCVRGLVVWCDEMWWGRAGRSD